MLNLAHEKLPEFLLAEYEHTADSFLRNEEDGERRVQFFLTLTTAIAGGLGFLLKKEGEPVTRSLTDARPFLIPVLIALLLFGMITFARLVQRNVVADRYKFALRSLRRCFVSEGVAGGMPNAFFELYAADRPEQRKLFTSTRVGWLEVVSLVNAFLACGLAFVVATPSFGTAIPFGAKLSAGLGFGLMLIAQIIYARRRYGKEWRSLNRDDTANLRAPPQG